MNHLPSSLPTISVVIPCYNQGRFLSQAIESALSQTHRAHEIIVVDDGSTDETSAVARSFGDKIVCIHQSNSGVSAARNAGLARATGNYVAFLDADDYLLPEMLATHVSTIHKTNADVTCSGWKSFDSTGVLSQDRAAPEFKPDAFHALLPLNPCPPLCYVIRRSTLNAAGGFDQRLTGHEDWDLLFRIAAKGASFVPISRALAAYRTHPGSASRNYGMMFDTGMEVLARTRVRHPRCPACGDRFAMAYRRFFQEYFSTLLAPAMSDHPLSRKHWMTWRNFLVRSIHHPSLAKTAAIRFLAAMARRSGIKRRIPANQEDRPGR